MSTTATPNERQWKRAGPETAFVYGPRGYGCCSSSPFTARAVVVPDRFLGRPPFERKRKSSDGAESVSLFSRASNFHAVDKLDEIRYTMGDDDGSRTDVLKDAVVDDRSNRPRPLRANGPRLMTPRSVTFHNPSKRCTARKPGRVLSTGR